VNKKEEIALKANFTLRAELLIDLFIILRRDQ
jgi:hypothetical protein